MSWKNYVYSIIGAEISLSTRYYDRAIHWEISPTQNPLLKALVRCKNSEVVSAQGTISDLSTERNTRTAIILNGAFNHHFDIEGLLTDLKPRLSRTSRIIAVVYNPYLSWLYRLANRIGLRQGAQPNTFLTEKDFRNLANLSGYEIVSLRPAVYCPWRLMGIGTFINRMMPVLPGFRWLGLVAVMIFRPIIPEKSSSLPSLSVIIPARNEKGNIENALKRMPDLGTSLEIIFVEGHSNDQTWEEIERVISLYSPRFNIRAFRQTGKGKADAVRLGFSEAKGDLLTILDADLTMPPELLGRFFKAYCRGHADFVNGTRLVYPMEGEAMRFLNLLGNVFFAKALSAALGTRLGDSLCGTKLVSRHDYSRFIQWRKDFGDFDPFGDFELLFPASILGLGVVDIPIRYRARTYGETNINRFRHGLMLLKMTTIGFFRIKLGCVETR
jgi:hypothetical protein